MQTISARCKFPLPILFLVIGHPHLYTLKSSQPDKLNWLIVMHCTYYCTYSRKCSTHLTYCFFNPSKNKKKCYNFIHWNILFILENVLSWLFSTPSLRDTKIDFLKVNHLMLKKKIILYHKYIFFKLITLSLHIIH